ncbi:hypothetical protein H8958_009005, partial [Nasalis larvatus]
MALKNSKTGSLPVSEIYSFMKEHFPYFKTAPDGWKNSVRHNLSLNKCFEKVENKMSGSSRKGCLWALNLARIDKMEEEMHKWKRKDLAAIHRSMANPPQPAPHPAMGRAPIDFINISTDMNTEVDALDPSIMDFALQDGGFELRSFDVKPAHPNAFVFEREPVGGDEDEGFSLDTLGAFGDSPLGCDPGASGLTLPRVQRPVLPRLA